ncbi:unnamed protein product [Agarophyton chilense]
MAGIIFSDSFKIWRLDWDEKTKSVAKKFDKVSRIEGKSEAYETEMTLDINTELYPVSVGETIELLITERLEEGPPNPDDPRGYNPVKPLGDRANMYDYIMRGKIFKYTEDMQRADIYFSFGGLLMKLHDDMESIELLF